MSPMKKILAILIIGLVIAGTLYFAEGRSEKEAVTESAGSGVTPAMIAEIARYEYTEEYVDPAKRFSFNYPAQFNVSTTPSETGEAILVRNLDTNIGVQILITPFGEDTDITADMIRRDIPNMQIESVQEVEIGSARKGVAFLSDNPNFGLPAQAGGSSRDVWFVYKKELYQITTYAEQDEFLKGLFGTWKFF